MHKFIALAQLELKKTFEKPRNYIIMFFMPLLFTVIFGNVFGGEVKKELVYVVDEDQSPFSKQYVKGLNNNSIFEVQEQTVSTAEKDLSNKKVSMMLIVKHGFMEQIQNGDKPPIDIVSSPGNESVTLFQQFAENEWIKLHLTVVGNQSITNENSDIFRSNTAQLHDQVIALPSQIKEETILTTSVSPKMYMSQRASGFIIMFLMIIMMSSTGSILEARQTGVWSRMLTTPTSKVQVLAGYLVAFFLIGAVQLSVLIVSTNLLFDVQWGYSFSFVLLMILLLTTVIGLGLFISTMVKSVEQQNAFGNLLIISTCMLGGVFWPLEITPTFMQTIAKYIPQTWAMDGLTSIAGGGVGIIDVWEPLIVLTGFTILFFTGSLMKMKFSN